MNQWPDAQYDKERAAAPFLLAAVCQTWRLLTRSSSHFWTYFGFPKSTSLSPRHLERLNVLLAVSSNAPVDVVLDLFWDEPDSGWSRLEPDPRIHACAHIVRAINDIGARWRHVHLRLSLKPMELLRGSLQSSLPGIQSLSIQSEVPWNMIPRGPQLSRLYVDCEEFDKEARWEQDSPGRPILTNLAIMANINHGEKMFRALSGSVGQQLRKLCLLDICPSGGNWPTIELNLLETLTVVDGWYLKVISAQNLLHLQLDASSLPPFVEEENFPRVETVTLFDIIDSYSFKSLSLLTKVCTLNIALPTSVKMSSDPGNVLTYVANGAWSAFDEPTFWPHLHCIRILDKDEDLEDTYHITELRETVRRRNYDIASTGLIEYVVVLC